ncbi:ABC transporter substrate-binding protein [Neobacillus rhizophilus]|uniref:ABC transporter substrate-binding protein n=1 Tax=Neobacillus rhizophilus TaxID=2833579 RepID=A0A942U1A0_9BACI|nr:ABC transporter substrate-binding protein [Neobacillus rhizophilus]MBS4212721.1 ABC transporter substrate-binding protein [Neobacillus rhizophilus]MBU8915149.1 ABC transporter substrate-binding protein [Bacillus sp. FJAT-29953]
MLKKTIGTILSTFLLASTLAGCASSSSSAKDESSSSSSKGSEPFKISMITPLTGNNTFGGNEFKNGAELAIEHLGGEINGRKIEMEFADGPDQNATLSEFERLYNKGSRVFVSGYGSGADRTFATMVDEMQVLYLSLAWDKDLIQGKSDYFYRVGANVVDFSSGAMDQAVSVGEKYLGKDAKDLKVAVVYTSNFEHIVEPFKERAKKLGVKLALVEAYPNDTKDFVPIITKLKNTDYDILVPFQGVTDGTPFQKKMHELKYTPPLTIGAGIYYDTPVFSNLGNDITDGILSQSYVTPFINEEAAKGSKKFREDYKKKYGHDPLTHALQAYGIVNVLAKALESVDPAKWDDTKELAAAVKKLDIDYGELPWYWGVSFDKNNSNTKADKFILGQWNNGSLETVFPDNLKTKDPIIPWEKK